MLEHILVVEDDEFVRSSLETELKLAGYRVTLAENGQQAVELARREAFDLVVCDIRMPGMNGIETLSALREMQPTMRNIVMTGYADMDAPIQAVKLRVDDYLVKPFSADDFLEAVKKALRAQLEELKRHRNARSLRHLLLASYRRLAEPDCAQASLLAAQRATSLGRRLGLSAARLESLQLVCWLHQHPQEVAEFEDFKPLANLMDHLRECWDGSGPRGWKGLQIPLEARILRLALGLEGGCDPDLQALVDLQEEAPAATPESGPRSLLALAQSYLDAGQLELAQSALQPLLEPPEGGELGAEAWLLAGRIAHLRGQLDSAREAASRAFLASQSTGQERRRSQASLLRAALGQAQVEELRQAREVFQALDHSLPRAECCLWLALLGDSQHGLLQALPQAGELWFSHTQPLSQALAPQAQDSSLSDLILEAKDPALGVLSYWLKEDMPLALRLKALDLLALMATPAARNLLEQMSHDQHPALAQKSGLLVRQQEAPARPQLQLYLLGRMRLAVGGQVLSEDGLAAKKTRHLLAYLAWTRSKETSEEVLMDMFWPHSGSKARHSLHNAIYQIRKSLRGWLGEEGEGMVRSSQGYSLLPHPALWSDCEEFLQLCQDSSQALRQSQTARAMADLKRAELLYRGEFLEGSYEDWLEPVRQALQERLTSLLTALGRVCFEQGRHNESLDYWKRLVQQDNCNEDAYLGCMLCYLALGRAGEAVRAYHQCSQNLRQDLNLAPSPRLMEIYLKLQAGETVAPKDLTPSSPF